MISAIILEVIRRARHEPDIVSADLVDRLRSHTNAEVPSYARSRAPQLYYGLSTVRPRSRPETGSLLLTSQFRRQKFSEFLPASLSRRRSRVPSPVVPAIPFQHFPSLFQLFVLMWLPTPGDSNRHEMPPNTRIKL